MKFCVNNENAFDERQAIERGRAFKSAYFVLVIMMLVCYLVNSMTKDALGGVIFDEYNIMYLPVWISGCVFTATAISRDAYMSFKQKSSIWIPAVYGIGGIIFLFGAVWELIFESDKFSDKIELIQNSLSPILFGVSAITVSIIWIAKYVRDKSLNNE